MIDKIMFDKRIFKNIEIYFLHAVSKINKYFVELTNNNEKYKQFEAYLYHFYNFCFELPSKNMIKEIQNYKF